MKLSNYLKKYKFKIALQLLIKISGTLIELALPFILSYIMDELLPKRDLKYIIIFSLLMALFAVIACISNIIANKMAASVAKNVTYEIRRDLFTHILYLSREDQEKITDERLISNITSDTYNIFQMLCMIFRIGIRSPFLLIGGIIVTLFLDYRLALVFLIFIPFILLITIITCIKNLKQFNKSLKKSENIISLVKEDILGIKVIKGLDKLEYEKEKFEKINVETSNLEKKALKLSGIINPILTFILDLCLVVVIIYGCYLVKHDLSKVGKIIAFTTYFTITSNALISISRIFQAISKGTTSKNRIKEVMDYNLEEFENNKLTSDYFIEFRNVSFYKSGKIILDDISFTLNKGETLGVIGMSGSGKSTILNLLTRIYKPSKGFIFINGINIQNYDKSSLNALFGVVYQTDTLFNDTVKFNITLNKEYSKDLIDETLKLTDSYNFVYKLENNLEYKLSRNASNLSGGQRQRLLISRAILKDPSILILDDSFSALDYKTDLLIRTNLKKLNKTYIYVAQRISSIKDANKIIVLNNGKIEAFGDIDSISNSKTFKNLLESQIGGDFDAA